MCVVVPLLAFRVLGNFRTIGVYKCSHFEYISMAHTHSPTERESSTCVNIMSMNALSEVSFVVVCISNYNAPLEYS